MLSKKLRKRIREIARQNYAYQKGGKNSVVFNAIAGSQRQIKQEFGGGIITSLLVGLMVKLAIRYIEQWAEDNLFSYHVPTNFSEPRKNK